jgi:hypothetical protein
VPPRKTSCSTAENDNDAKAAKLLDMLEPRGPITVSAGNASYQLPPIDIDKWRKPFDLCGFGYWVTPRDFPVERW